MKALSIHPQFAMLIFAGYKTVEIRTWTTNYRGDLLICSTQHKIKDTIPGHAVCVVTLEDVVPFAQKHVQPSHVQPQSIKNFEGLYAWEISNVRYIRPIPLKGKLGLWNYDGEIEYLQEPETDEEDEKMYHEIFEPLFV